MDRAGVLLRGVSGDEAPFLGNLRGVAACLSSSAEASPWVGTFGGLLIGFERPALLAGVRRARRAKGLAKEAAASCTPLLSLAQWERSFQPTQRPPSSRARVCTCARTQMERQARACTPLMQGPSCCPLHLRHSSRKFPLSCTVKAHHFLHFFSLVSRPCRNGTPGNIFDLLVTALPLRSNRAASEWPLHGRRECVKGSGLSKHGGIKRDCCTATCNARMWGVLQLHAMFAVLAEHRDRALPCTLKSGCDPDPSRTAVTKPYPTLSYLGSCVPKCSGRRRG